jgi:hypothetical protein
MLEAIITIVGLCSIILATHNYMLEEMHKDASGQPKFHSKVSEPISHLHHEKLSRPN